MSFFRRHALGVFVLLWLCVITGAGSYAYVEINKKLNAQGIGIPAAEFNIKKTTIDDIFSSQRFTNLRSIATRPTDQQYTACLAVPGRPHVFSGFVQCQ